MKLTNAEIIAISEAMTFFDGWVEDGKKIIPSAPWIPVGYALSRNSKLFKEPLLSYTEARTKIVGEAGIPDGDPRQPQALVDLKALNLTEIEVAIHQFPASALSGCVPSVPRAIGQALLSLFSE
jgi:hypothetical protein